ncbi:MAG: alpha-amylase family glycosyl hydrolase, partial [Pseudomonadota bacterium]
MRVPRATYRLQFNRSFLLDDGSELVDYLERLGISDIYASPLTAARPGSLHCYDVIDHGQISPECGGEESFVRLTDRLMGRGMGLLLDVVPNHMCISGSNNRWWNDVLENGPSSPWSSFFDVEWQPPKTELTNRVLLPILGDQYGEVLERGEIGLAFLEGEFVANYRDVRLPIAPGTCTLILDPMLEALKRQLGDEHPSALELASIRTAMGYLAPRTETRSELIQQRQREKEVIKKRLLALVETDAAVRAALDECLADFNGTIGVPESFDRLEGLLAQQAFRLSYWRVAADETNYRRFFDINELAAIRAECP